jgi:hypothetical protein
MLDIMFDQHQHKDDRTQPTGHDVQKGEVKPLGFAARSQLLPTVLMRFNRKDSQYSWVSVTIESCNLWS